MGAVTDAVRRYVPASYNEMIMASNSPVLYTTGDLQALADYVKFKLYSTIVNATEELDAYGPALCQFIGKLTTIQFIPSAVDFWDSRLASLTATGTNEVLSYRDHRESLLKLFDLLTQQAEEEAKLFDVNLKAAQLTPGVSYGDNGRGVLITVDPQEWPAMDDCSTVWPPIPWSTP